MISACLTQYPHSFGCKVFREGFPFPGLDVYNAVVLKRSLEVKGSGRLQCGEFVSPRHHEDEAGDTVHPVGRFPQLEVAEHGLDEVGREVVHIVLVLEQREAYDLRIGANYLVCNRFKIM